VSSRSEILSALRRAAPADPGLPAGPLSPAPVRYPDLPARFAEALSIVGGKPVRVPDALALRSEVAGLAASLGARRVLSCVPGADGDVALDALDALEDPHQLEGVDLAILPGEFGVAETGAVWLNGAGLRHRGVFVVTQHLALVLSARAIVNDMHEAYARIQGRFDGPGFGLFIAGPSKTADIEQALVIGAHGARSCTVFVVG
jgi:L-lactate dehydrogenase complex protein LldG